MADVDGSQFGETIQGARTPAQRTRVAQIQQEPEVPPPPPQPGQELELPLDVAQQPRGGVLLGDERADHLLIEYDVTNNRFFQADSFRLTLAYVEDDEKFGRGFWDSTDRVEVEIFAGYGVEEPPSTSLLAGRADEIQIDMDARTVTLSGRDYTADLIEKRMAEKYPNKTSSEIVRILAGEAGLTPEVTDTRQLAGVYYRAEHAQLADETTAWNLITFLAEREGFDAYVIGKKLYFAAPMDPISAKRWTLQYTPPDNLTAFPTALASSLTLTKALTISREIVVKVISWNSSRKHSLTGQSRSARPNRGAGGQFASAPAYIVREPNLTQDQADQRAKQIAEQITRELRTFDAALPGHPDVDIQTMVLIRGTNTSFDTDYHLDEIERRMSMENGFTMRLRGRNVIPDDTAAL